MKVRQTVGTVANASTRGSGSIGHATWEIHASDPSWFAGSLTQVIAATIIGATLSWARRQAEGGQKWVIILRSFNSS